MHSKEHYLQRAERLRATLKYVDDPIARRVLEALVKAFEEAAATAEIKRNDMH